MAIRYFPQPRDYLIQLIYWDYHLLKRHEQTAETSNFSALTRSEENIQFELGSEPGDSRRPIGDKLLDPYYTLAMRLDAREYYLMSWLQLHIYHLPF